MASTAKKTAAKETSMDDVTEQMAILRDDISALTTTLAELVQDKSSNLSDAAKAKAEEAQRKVQDGADQAMNQAANARAYVEDTVARNPGGALAVAAGVGFLVGMISARR